MAQTKKVIGIDIGGTNIKMGLVDTTGNLYQKQKVPTDSLLQKGSFSEALAEIIENYIGENNIAIDQIGIGCPAILCPRQRQCIEFANLSPLNGVHLLDDLESYLPNIKFFLENDANAAAFGEFIFAKNHNKKDFLFITLGTGVGGGAVINGNIFHGALGNACEVGHMAMGEGKVLEDTIGKKGIANLYKKISGKQEEKDKTPAKVVKLYEKGDASAKETLQKIGETLGYGLTSAIRILDVHTIIIGGGVGSIYPLIEKSMYVSLEKMLVPYYLDDLEIICSELQNEAGILGAAALCFQNTARRQS